MDTPFGSLTVDDGVRAELVSSGKFDLMSQQMDEEEHSVEMQLPFIAHAMRGVEGVTVIPMVTGAWLIDMT
jgi:MEMO1 family protein